MSQPPNTPPKARPVLFSGPMIRALLDGRKSQTRRVLKRLPSCPPDDLLDPTGLVDTSTAWWTHPAGLRVGRSHPCPYGRPGDLLWVREAFSYESRDVDRSGSMPPWFWADGNPTSGDFTKPKPSIHMPRWASRLTLELTAVRAERLQAITEADAMAEGCFFTDYGRRCLHLGQGDVATCPAPPDLHPRQDGWMWARTTSPDQCLGSARTAYGNLWESINGPNSWFVNPYVWVLEFAVHRRNVDALLRERAA